MSSDLASAAEQLRDTRRALDQTRAELTRTQRESEAKLAALDADAKQAVSRAQQVQICFHYLLFDC